MFISNRICRRWGVDSIDPITSKRKKNDINDKAFMKNIESSYLLFWQANDKKDSEKIEICLELLVLIQPFMKNENEKGKVESLRNKVLNNLRVSKNDNKTNEKYNNKIESIIGSNEYKWLFVHQSKIGTELNIEFDEPILKVKELSKQNMIETKEFSHICNDVDFYLFDKEKSIVNKLELILATFELSKNINEISKNETDKSKVGWYAVINETMRGNSLKYLIEFKSDKEKNIVVEKYILEINKYLIESEVKELKEIKTK